MSWRVAHVCLASLTIPSTGGTSTRRLVSSIARSTLQFRRSTGSSRCTWRQNPTTTDECWRCGKSHQLGVRMTEGDSTPSNLHLFGLLYIDGASDSPNLRSTGSRSIVDVYTRNAVTLARSLASNGLVAHFSVATNDRTSLAAAVPMHGSPSVRIAFTMFRPEFASRMRITSLISIDTCQVWRMMLSAFAI